MGLKKKGKMLMCVYIKKMIIIKWKLKGFERKRKESKKK
jgi:hypothetical protein